MLGDVVVATGMSFAEVAGMTRAQFAAVEKAVRRHWEMTASVNGLRAFLGAPPPKSEDHDDTAAFTEKVKAVKKATGKSVLDLREVL